MHEDKDRRFKYIEMPREFQGRASTVDFHCKQSQAICEKLASFVARQKAKTPDDFEKLEYFSEFIVKTAKNNEETLSLLNYMRGFLQDIADDAKVLTEGAILRDKLDFQSDTLQLVTQQRDDLVNEICGRNKKNTQQSIGTGV